MFRQILALFSLIYLCTCDDKIQSDFVAEKNRMMGIDAIHDNTIKIDKDTKITRNLKLESRKNGPTSNANTIEEGKEPDWSYKPYPTEVADHVLQFKRNMTECLKEVQANDKRPIKRLSPKVDSPVHGECLIACVLKRNGVIENGKINKENVLLLVGKFFAKDTKLMKKLEKNMDRCVEISVHNQDECQLASQLNDCTNDLMASNKHKIMVNY